ncbi:MAG TPA: crossover junction endodeoxyribonuclease RuvC [Syntrophobacteraceae bacterium]|nr:crossover junction endodeoxyribonuclease RuvC [Syntrophobacteraceae bacterium]
MIRAIGIDPGSRYTGYGVVEGDGSVLRHVSNGVISLPGSQPLPERLSMIYRQLAAIIDEIRPSCLAIEDVFFAKNVKSALSLGQARGAAILAGINAGLPVFEYSALQVKQAVAGYGKAGKDQMMRMIQYLFRLTTPPNSNAADALAVAICHLNTQSSKIRWSESERS